MAHDHRPEGWTDLHEVIAQALYADLWTEPNEEYGPEWHHRFQWWQCVNAAQLAVPAITQFDGSEASQ